MAQPQPPVPTMRELAAALKISVTTVSMALRNHPRVAPVTRRQVQSFAREKGYHLNPSLSVLMSHVRSSERAVYRETLAWINPSDGIDHYTNANSGSPEYTRKLWQGASVRAAELGYELDNFWLAAPGMNSRRMNKILASRGIRGLLLPPLSRSCGHLSINWANFAAVALTYTVARPELHRVVPDHHNNMQLILRTMRHRGYHRAGLLFSSRFDERLENRLRSAFYFYQQSLPARDRIPVLVCQDPFEKTAAAWLKIHRPDAVITLGGYRKLREIPIGDPAYSKNLGIVLMGHAATDEGFSAIDENPLLIGSSAVDHLVAQLNRNEKGLSACPQTVLIKGSWIEGQTLPKYRQEGPSPLPAQKRKVMV